MSPLEAVQTKRMASGGGGGDYPVIRANIHPSGGPLPLSLDGRRNRP